MSGSSTTAQNGASKVASADQFTAWQIHYADFAQLCNEAANTCEEASRLVQEYSDLCQEQQQYGLSTVDERRQREITSSKKAAVEALANNVQLQAHHSQELQRFQKTHEEYAEELGTMQTTLSEAAYFDTDPDVETYLDFLFGSVMTLADADAVTSDGAQRVEESSSERDRCIICLEEIPPNTTPCPLSENTAICLELFWDANNDNKIACPAKTGPTKVEHMNGRNAYVRHEGPVGTKADSRTDANESGKKTPKTGHVKVEKINGQHAYVRRHK
ncbi:hypothetical protein SLS58_004045 [Diplodia intermedia]|uniref:Uncharacterized protein n=1 Tax=Diplodia intermedia TaxID=856260 RepID=A0ABR3TUU5_9PEZI